MFGPSFWVLGGGRPNRKSRGQCAQAGGGRSPLVEKINNGKASKLKQVITNLHGRQLISINLYNWKFVTTILWVKCKFNCWAQWGVAYSSVSHLFEQTCMNSSLATSTIVTLSHIKNIPQAFCLTLIFFNLSKGSYHGAFMGGAAFVAYSWVSQT